MILKSIKLSNIRSYLSQEISFPQGSFLLSGDIGSGKSTILQAVEFALFGVMRNLPGTSLLRRGKSAGYVELSFKIDGKDITVKRALKRLKDSVQQDAGYLIIDGKKYDLTPSELKTKILEHLGYPDELATKSKPLIFRYTVYTPQEEMKQIIFEDKDARLDTLRRVFGIDKYKRIAANAEILIKNIKDQKKELTGKIFDLEEKAGQKKKLELEIWHVKKKLDEILPKYNEFRKETEKKKQAAAELEGNIASLGNLKRELEVNETKISNLAERKDKNVKEAGELQQKIKEINEKANSIKIKKSDFDEKAIEEQLKSLENEFLNSSRRSSELAEKISSNKKRAEELKKEIGSKSEKSKALAEKQSRLTILKKEAEARKETEEMLAGLEEDLLKLAKASSEYEVCKRNSSELKSKIKGIATCPTCFQPVNESHKHRIDAEEDKKIDLCSRQIEQISRRKADVSGELEKLRKKLKETEEKEKLIERLNAEIENLKLLDEELSEKNKLLSALVSELPLLEKEISSKNPEDERKKLEEKKLMLKAVQEQKNLLMEKEMLSKLVQEKLNRMAVLGDEEKEIKELMGGLKQKKTAIEAEIGKFRDAEKKYLQAKKELDDVIEKSKGIEIKKAELDKEKEGLDKNLSVLDNEINAKLEIKNYLLELSTKQHWLEEFFINLMYLMEKHVMHSVRAEFSELFQKWFSLMIEDEAVSISIDEDFTPLIEQNGYQTELADMSGGEKTSCALAYRLALNRIINDLMSTIKTKDIIILDEPTDGFSTEQLDKVRDVLEQLNAGQIILVSHEAKLESFVQNIIRIEKEGHVSRVVAQ